MKVYPQSLHGGDRLVIATHKTLRARTISRTRIDERSGRVVVTFADGGIGVFSMEAPVERCARETERR